MMRVEKILANSKRFVKSLAWGVIWLIAEILERVGCAAFVLLNGTGLVRP